MDPINGVLDETFFKVASPECLTALSKLIDGAFYQLPEQHHCG